MNRAVTFLQESETFYVATMDGDQPRVRPFGAAVEYNGKLYICTSNRKKCFKQMVANPKVEIAAMKGPDWIRISGEVAVDPSPEAKKYFLQERPLPMYKPDDSIFEILYFTKATVTITSATAPESFEI